MENYINSIFEKQSEQDMSSLITMYARENGLSTANIEEIISKEEEYCSQDVWGGLRFSRGQIKNILNQLN